MTIRDFLLDRLPAATGETVDQLLRDREVVSRDGPITADDAFEPHRWLWMHRPFPAEVPVPFDISVVHHDENVLVIDKPHFLATTPRGQHVRETALARLRAQWDLPELSPAHRLDRPTAGLVLFTTRRAVRGAYQCLFQDRLVRKEYEAVAAVRPELTFPCTIRNRLVKERGTLTASEVAGPPNAETHIDLLEQRGNVGRYRLRPTTGRTHQLRVHLSRLGIPILGDDFYPTLSPKSAHDFTRPLQLLASVLEFTDPITGRIRRFESSATLQAWTFPHRWAGTNPPDAFPVSSLNDSA